MKVLVVDDSAVMRKMVTRQLAKMGISESIIEEAGDGREAIEKCKKETYELVLMDWNMPNMLGIEALVTIRELGITTPIIMVTTESERENIITAVQAGATNYIVKPFTEDVFQTKVTQALDISHLVAYSKSLEPAQEVVNFAAGRIELD
jgi:two-component system chemotaxis response regulator CheY